MRFYHDNCEIRHGADTRELAIDYQSRIVVGKFVDRERPTYLESMNRWYSEAFGGRYETYEGSVK
jgi:2-oxoglutarate ferredoxin oxidoreductase subunit beta